MKPSHLSRHLLANHKELESKPVEYFQRHKNEYKGQRSSIGNFTRIAPSAVKCSFLVAYRIAKSKKPYTIAETLLQPVLNDVVKEMFGESALAKIKCIALSDTTIMRRINEMSADIEDQLISQIKMSGEFSLQFDESVDVAGEAILLGFVRYVQEKKIVEDLFCVCSLPDHTTGEAIFRAVEETFRKYDFSWENLVSICTDGASAMIGMRKGLATRIARVANEDFTSSHCVIHREALAVQNMAEDLKNTLNDAVHIVNMVKSKALQGRIFSLLCKEMGSEHLNLLYHTDVRWLSKGKMLSRVYELLSELRVYCQQHKKPEELNNMNDKKWQLKLAYLADIFGLLNELNLQLQGPETHCFLLHSKVDAFKKKIKYWTRFVAEENYSIGVRISCGK